MSFNDRKDIELWQTTRRKFLQISVLTGTLLSVDLFGPSKKIGFARDGDITPADMREKAMQLLKPPMGFM